MVLKENNLVKKRHVLNEIRRANMGLTELRFFAIYLSKIHRDKPEETRIVRFPLDDFRAIMELGRMNVKHMQKTVDSLLCKIVTLPEEVGGYTKFQLFKKCRVSKDEKEQWYVEIDAHDDALPLMFEFKNKYVSYRLFNALRLRSSNQMRMYEILKQHEGLGSKEFDIDELKELLWIGKEEYPRFGDFKNYVLNVCQKALAEHTDIKFTYEPCGNRGKGGKIYRLKFTIEENTEYTDQLTLDMFIEEQRADIEQADDEREPTPYENNIKLLSNACKDEFSEKEIEVLWNMMCALESEDITSGTNAFHYLQARYNLMCTRKPKSSRYGYLKALIGKEI